MARGDQGDLALRAACGGALSELRGVFRRRPEAFSPATVSLLREVGQALSAPRSAPAARPAGPPAPGGPARRVRLPVVPRRPAGDHRDAARGPGLRGGHADGRREVAHLSDTGAGPGGDHAGGLAAHRAHEGPGRRDDRGRAARDLPLGVAAVRRAPAAGPGALRRRVRALLRGARGDRSLGGARPRRPRPASHRRRRGSLHQPVGARLPAGLPEPHRPQAQVRRRADAGADRHRHARRHRRHHRAAGDDRSGLLPRPLLPPEPAHLDVPQGRADGASERRHEGRPRRRSPA